MTGASSYASASRDLYTLLLTVGIDRGFKDDRDDERSVAIQATCKQHPRFSFHVMVKDDDGPVSSLNKRAPFNHEMEARRPRDIHGLQLTEKPSRPTPVVLHFHRQLPSLMLVPCYRFLSPPPLPFIRHPGVVYEVGLGFIFRLPPVMVTLTKRRVYVILFFARPLGVFFFSWGSTCHGLSAPAPLFHLFYHLRSWRTFGVCDLTFPARAREPCTLPMLAVL